MINTKEYLLDKAIEDSTRCYVESISGTKESFTIEDIRQAYKEGTESILNFYSGVELACKMM